MNDIPVTLDPDRDHMSPLSAKQRALVTEMAWSGGRLRDAAQTVGMNVDYARNAIRKPHVMKALRAETHVLRSSMRPRAYHRLGDILDQEENKMAVVQAARTLLSDDASHGQVNVNVSITPGYAVDMGEWRREKVIEHQRIRIDGAGHGDTLAEDGE